MVAQSTLSAQAAQFPTYVGFAKGLSNSDDRILRLLHIVSAGAGGTVFRAAEPSSLHDASPKLYAVKAVADTRARSALSNEFHYHAQVSDHPNVATLHRAFHEGGVCYAVFDWFPGSSLAAAIRHNAPYLYDGALTRECFIQLVGAVGHLHAHGVAHRDVGPDNIMLSADNRTWILTNFHLASDTGARPARDIETSAYAAPEIASAARLDAAYLPAPADVWAVGVTFAAVLTAHAPRSTCAQADYAYGAQCQVHRAVPLVAPMRALLSRVLEPDPETRIALAELRAALEGAARFYPERVTVQCFAPDAVAVMG